MKNAIALLATLVFGTACSNGESVAAQKPATATNPPAAAAPASAAAQLSGTVIETFNGGGYTYLHVSTPNGQEWAAVPETKINKGDQVTLNAQMTMEDFQSNTLNRKFDRIVFATVASGAPGPAVTGAAEHIQSPDAGTIMVEKAPNGVTVAEVWSKKDSLKGKEVVVHAQVVKYLAGIMGRNWMHLQDGSGSREKGDHDLTVTTGGAAKVGDVVTIKGTVATDQDFGSGYRYAVIVENAAVTK
jgi:hypothetical protein